jgi:hypothetical protein
MSERLVIGGKLTNLQDPQQLGRLNDLLAQLCAITNNFDANSFALAWIDGFAAGAVISSRGVGNAPEWDTSPTLTGATLTGLSASQLVATNAGKQLVSDASNYIIGAGVNTITVSATPPVAPITGDLWVDVS